jgi:hypothetical protein
MHDVFNACWERIDFVNNSLVEFSEVFYCSNCSILLKTDKSWESPCTFPNLLKDAHGFLEEHFLLVGRNIMLADVLVKAFVMPRDSLRDYIN